MKIPTRIQAASWEPWMLRDFYPFLVSIIMEGGTAASFARINFGALKDQTWCIYNNRGWYRNAAQAEQTALLFGKHYTEQDVFRMVRGCEAYYRREKTHVAALVQSTAPPLERLAELQKLLLPLNAYLWLCHTAEDWFAPRLKRAFLHVYPAAAVAEAIAAFSKPVKKNAHEIMQDWMREGKPPATIHAEFAWIKSRGGFKPGYTLAEIKELKKSLSVSSHKPMRVPTSLKKEIAVLQELVYFRLFRTDVLYEFLYMAQPLFDAVAKELGIDSVQHYFIDDLVHGKPQRVELGCMMALVDGKVAQFPPLRIAYRESTGEVRGTVAYRGVAQGRAKIILDVADISKVKKGDILLTNMTVPSFIPAMQRAAAFVTDEGGITCHAAVVAREMQKPCVIGTKQATRVFKDGDMIEVDAVKGIVRKIK